MSKSAILEAPAIAVEIEGNGLDATAKSKPRGRRQRTTRIEGVRIGLVVGLKNEGRTPLVMFPGQRTSAAREARSTMDLHGAHIGREVVLMFEEGDPDRPIILGCFPKIHGWPDSERSSHVEVEADGERLLVSAEDQLVLKCGKASITLTKAGKVLIQGSYVSSRSTGVNRVKGGSVQLN